MHQEDFQKLLKKFKDGLCTPEEEKFIEAWFRSMEETEDPLFTGADKDLIKQRSWARVHGHIRRFKNKDGRTARGRTIQISPRAFAAIAAAILIVVVSSVFLFLRNTSNGARIAATEVAEKKISNNSDGIMEVQLSDGSKIFLKPQSSVFFDEPFKDSQRFVLLEGEAFFTVSRDTLRPFLVSTNEIITKVLGTSFTISAFPDEDKITVSVRTGKVSVITKHGTETEDGAPKETILTPNQTIIYNKNNNLVSRAIVEDPVRILPDHVVKRMQFEAAPIREVFEGLEKVYGVDIEFDHAVFASCILTTSIAEGSIYNRLDMICEAIDAHYAIEENVIVVTGRGCKSD